MTESADLLAAIAAAPADDLPRLVFADWLDDRGEPDYAQFIRDQIRLAQVPQWDPLAVRARHQLKDSLGIGRPFFGTLPQLPIFLKWHPEKAFRRGFGSGVVVHQLSGLLEAGPQLFDLAPVEELWLSAATLDDWRQLAKSPWLKHVRKLHFHFSQGLHEPIRCLAESKYAYNIDEIWFDTLETPAAGLVIEALAQSPLAGQLKGLHLRLVHTPSLLEVIAALAAGKFEKLERFSMAQAGLGHHDLVNLRDNQSLASLKAIDLSGNPLSNIAFGPLFVFPDFQQLDQLVLSSCELSERSIYKLATERGEWLENLSSISLSDNRFGPVGLGILRKQKLKSIRHLDISKCGLTNNELVWFVSSCRWYRRLAEVQIGHNELKKTSEYFLDESIPMPLIALELNRMDAPRKLQSRLESHFGDRLVWATDDAPTGLAR